MFIFLFYWHILDIFSNECFFTGKVSCAVMFQFCCRQVILLLKLSKSSIMSWWYSYPLTGLILSLTKMSESAMVSILLLSRSSTGEIMFDAAVVCAFFAWEKHFCLVQCKILRKILCQKVLVSFDVFGGKMSESEMVLLCRCQHLLSLGMLYFRHWLGAWHSQSLFKNYVVLSVIDQTSAFATSFDLSLTYPNGISHCVILSSQSSPFSSCQSLPFSLK